MRTNPESHAVPTTQARIEQDLVDTVLASFAQAQDARFHTLMCSLVRHLHDFIREVRLSEAEWARAIAFLTATGQISTEARAEFVLLSDVLGASMQTIAVNNEVHGGATESTIFGPFFAEDAPLIELGGDIAGGAPGQPCWVRGTITDTAGDPVPGARIEVWQADDTGLYDAQYDDSRVAGRAHLFADDRGGYCFWGLTPTPYPIPHDGPVGQLLSAAGRSPMRAAHLHFMVTAPGKRTLVTHIFVRGDEQLKDDAVFGVKESLIHTFELHPATAPAPAHRALGGCDWSEVQFDVVLEPQQDTVSQ